MTKAVISVGAAAPKEHVEHVAAAIERILRAAYESHAGQATVREALQTLAQTVKVENVTIRNCHIRGDNTLLVDLDADEPDIKRRPDEGTGIELSDG